MRLQTELGWANIVESLDDLPEIPDRISELYLDVETTSGDPKKEAFSPYEGARIAGIAITWETSTEAWYLPIHHVRAKWNLPVAEVIGWLQEVIRRSKVWINHNIKFDAHFVIFEGIKLGDIELHDTLNSAKLFSSERYSHALKILARDWLKLKMEDEQLVDQYLQGIKSKDYGEVPADILGKYACMDVLSNRLLYKKLREALPTEMVNLWNQENKLTPVLLDMELEGLFIDGTKKKLEALESLKKILAVQEIAKTKLGIFPLVDSTECLYEVFCVHLGLPVLKRTKKTEKGGGDNPSFSKDVIKQYAVHPKVVNNPEIAEIVSAIKTWKVESTFYSLLLNPMLEAITNIVHPRYNQSVRTGRMSCSGPNSQQFNARAKDLIIPQPGRSLICGDASQMEFRVIAHYCRMQGAIEAYRKDPTTDYHQWVADLCRVKRQPAKTLNFAMAFGAGEDRITHELANNEDIIQETLQEVNDLVAQGKLLAIKTAVEYERRIIEKAQSLYRLYHRELPELAYTAAKARVICTQKGYIENKYGRRRHLKGRKAVKKAFNAMVQGCAMDIIKERMIAVAARYNPYFRSHDVRLIANVHDELLFSAPTEVANDATVLAELKKTLESVQMEFRVPFVWDLGVSNKSWKHAKQHDTAKEEISITEDEEELEEVE